MPSLLVFHCCTTSSGPLDTAEQMLTMATGAEGKSLLQSLRWQGRLPSSSWPGRWPRGE